MKFLCHSAEATYDSTDKDWKYTLDKRIQNPTAMVLSKACFSVPTNYANPPHVVYLRSHAFDRMIQRKHVVELKNNNHMGSSNVLAVLSETHTRGRYRYYGNRRFTLDPSYSSKTLDFYFTDGTNLIEGEYQAGSSSTTTTTPAGESDIVAIHTAGDLHVWLSLETTTCLNAGFTPVTALDDASITTLTNRTSDAPQNVLFGTGTGPFARTTLGQTHCIYNGGSNWNSVLDATNNPLFPDDSEFSFNHLFRAPATLVDTYYFENERGLRLYFNDNNSISFQSAANAWVEANLIWYPNHVYLLTIERRGTTANNDAALYWTLKNLTTDANQTDTTADGYRMHTGGNATTGYDMRFGAANTSTHHQIGPMIIYLNPTDDRKTKVRNYLESLYTGTAVTTENQEETSANNENAEFFIELDIKTA